MATGKPDVTANGERLPVEVARIGLEVLFAKPDPKECSKNARNLDAELRERFWIRQASDLGVKAESWANVGVTIPIPIERDELGRTRNESGDGFRYLFRTGTGGTGERTEWFEVTEVFEGVKAKDIKSFMRLENGGAAHPGFNPQEFLRELKLGIPRRAAQRRAADKVIRAVKRKLTKSSYKDMVPAHGYGTLIVGLPLWFATGPLDPLRAENVIDDFKTRVEFGLKEHTRRLRGRYCPFWRIVIVWKSSAESLREWTRKARIEAYVDPAYRRIGSLPIRGEVQTSILLKLVEATERLREINDAFDGITCHIAVAHPEKKEGHQVELPPAVAELRRHLAEIAYAPREGPWDRVKTRFKLRLLEVLCFKRAFGINGLQRWLIHRLSPRRRLAQYAMRRRANRLYQASNQRSGFNVS